MQPHKEKVRLFTVVYLLLWFIGSFWGMGVLKSGTMEWLLGVRIADIEEYAYCAFAGAIGGTLYALRMLHEYYDNMSARWLYWYAIRPVLCAGSAMVMIVLLRSGIMLLQISDTLEAQIGVSFLVGYGYGKFMDKLKTLTEALLNGSSSNGSAAGGNGTGSANGKQAAEDDQRNNR